MISEACGHNPYSKRQGNPDREQARSPSYQGNLGQSIVVEWVRIVVRRGPIAAWRKAIAVKRNGSGAVRDRSAVTRKRSSVLRERIAAKRNEVRPGNELVPNPRPIGDAQAPAADVRPGLERVRIAAPKVVDASALQGGHEPCRVASRRFRTSPWNAPWPYSAGSLTTAPLRGVWRPRPVLTSCRGGWP